jgi:branched-chain amino acid transport system permease protein
MKAWSRSRAWDAARTWALLALLVGIPVLAIAAAGTSSIERVTTNFLILAGLVVGLQTFVGNSGIVSFGHVAFFGVGAYVTALLTIPPNIKEFALRDWP